MEESKESDIVLHIREPVLLQPRQRYSSLHSNSNQYGNSVFEINRGARSICSLWVSLAVPPPPPPLNRPAWMRAIGPGRKKHARAHVCVDICTLGEHQGRRAISASAPHSTPLNLLIFKGKRVLIQFLVSPWTLFCPLQTAQNGCLRIIEAALQIAKYQGYKKKEWMLICLFVLHWPFCRERVSERARLTSCVVQNFSNFAPLSLNS